ncbi:MAG: arcB [Bacteroidetes bacterium]|nr:arcB [Bacteroidota bacterium]
MKTYNQLNEGLKEPNTDTNIPEETSIYQLLIAESLSKEDYSSIFRALNDNSLTGIYIVENGLLKYVNPVLTNIFGFTKDEVIGRSLLEFVHPEDQEAVIGNIQEFFEGNKTSMCYEFRGIKKNGEIVYLQEFGGLDSSDSSNIFIGNIIDITEKKKIELELEEYRKNLEQRVAERTRELTETNKRLEAEISERKNIESDFKKNKIELEKRVFERTRELIEANNSLCNEIELSKKRQRSLEKSEARLFSAVHTAGLGLYEQIGQYNNSGRETFFDEKARQIFAIPEGEEKNWKDYWMKYTHPDDLENVLEIIYQFNRGGLDFASATHRYNHPEMGEIWIKNVAYSLKRDSEGLVSDMIGVAQDVTDQKRSELELIAAKERAEESDRLKLSFLQNMSHEVKTPLNSIIGFSQVIAQSVNENEKLEQFSKLISQNSEKLIKIINDIVEISQIYAKQIYPDYKEFDIIQSLYYIANKLIDKAKLKGIELILNLDIPLSKTQITTDQDKFEKILLQIIENAIKFTKEGFVKVDCHLQGDNLEIQIEDTGIGIPLDKQKIIFEPFRQLDTGTTRTYGGNGLGLALAKAYTDLLGGNINFESQINEGTKVRISIPFYDHKKQE